MPPVELDTEGSDGSIAFRASSDLNVAYYVIWYKVFSEDLSQNEINARIQSDLDYFKDEEIREGSRIKSRGYFELYLGESLNDEYLWIDKIPANAVVHLYSDRHRAGNYISLELPGGQVYDVRRNVPESSTDNRRKPFLDEFKYDTDQDTKSRKSEFANNDTDYALNFIVQSGYQNVDDFVFVWSEIIHLGTFYDLDNVNY